MYMGTELAPTGPHHGPFLFPLNFSSVRSCMAVTLPRGPLYNKPQEISEALFVPCGMGYIWHVCRTPPYYTQSGPPAPAGRLPSLFASSFSEPRDLLDKATALEWIAG